MKMKIPQADAAIAKWRPRGQMNLARTIVRFASTPNTACKFDFPSLLDDVTINYRDTLGHPARYHHPPLSRFSHGTRDFPLLDRGMEESRAGAACISRDFRVLKRLGGGGSGGSTALTSSPPFPPPPPIPDRIGLAGTSRSDGGADHLDKCNLVGAAMLLLSLDSGFSANDGCCHRDALSAKK